MKTAHVMKRALSLALVLMFLTTCLVAAFASGKSYYVNVDKLRVRSGPGSSYSTVKTLKRNAVVTKTGHSGGWWHIKYSGGSGYVYKTYLSSSKSSSSSSSSSSSKYKTTSRVHLRVNASASSGILKNLKKGAKVTLKKKKGSWAYVNYNGTLGWIATKYLTKA